MAERPFEPVPNTPLVADPTGDAIWKRWLQNLQRFLGNAVRGPGSSTDNAVARWNGTTGTFLNNSGVIIDDSNNVSGVVNLTTTGSTILGDASADTLTINAGTWTYGANWTATRATGAFSGSIDVLTNIIQATPNASASAQGAVNRLSVLGSNNPATMIGFRGLLTQDGTGTITTAVGASYGVSVLAAGNVTEARALQSFMRLTSTGAITTGMGLSIETPERPTGTGTITTNYGVRVKDMGASWITTAIGVSVEDQTSATTMIGVQSAVSAGTGKKNLNITGTADNVMAGNVKIGATTSPAAPLDVLQSTLGSAVQILASTASNDDPTETVYQNKVTTTDATATTIATVAIPASTTVFIEAKVVARRTGGAAGTAEDGAAYMVDAVYKNVAGTATEIGEASVFSAEDQAGWNVSISPSGGNALIQVTGAVNNNVSWIITYRVYSVST